MQNNIIHFLFIAFSVFYFTACQPTPVPVIGENLAESEAHKDSLKTRTPFDEAGRLSVKGAFVLLSNKELILDGIENMSPQDRKKLLQLKESDSYDVQWEGNYLSITEKPKNPDDKAEQIEQIRLVAFNASNQKNILFVSQELIDEQRNITKVVSQTFLQFNRPNWENVEYQLPTIKTKTFLSDDTTIKAEQDHIYFELDPTDVNYLQAYLKYEAYSDKEALIQAETYKVALTWNGEKFQLDRQALAKENGK